MDLFFSLVWRIPSSVFWRAGSCSQIPLPSLSWKVFNFPLIFFSPLMVIVLWVSNCCHSELEIQLCRPCWLLRFLLNYLLFFLGACLCVWLGMFLATFPVSPLFCWSVLNSRRQEASFSSLVCAVSWILAQIGISPPNSGTFYIL